MARKPTPELETLKDLAKQSEERLRLSLRRLKKTLHIPEDNSDMDQKSLPHSTGQD